VFCQQCGARIHAQQQPAPAEARHPFTPAVPGAMPYPEEDLWSGAYSPQAMLGTWVTAGVVSLVLLTLAFAFGRGEHAKLVWTTVLSAIAILAASVAGRLAYRKFSIQYRLTNQRLFYVSGIFKRTTDLIELININDVGFEQGPVERMLTGTGTIRVYSKDQSHPKLFMQGIADVVKVVDVLDNARRAERRRRGLQMLGGELRPDTIDGGHAS
jgi:membrane protein YdbS with pleckstrin-like domain